MPQPHKEIVISNKEVGERLRALRHEQELSQGQLAAMLGIPPTNISAIERGVRGLSLQHLAKIARALDVPAGAILDDKHTKPSPKTTTQIPRRFERVRKLPRTKRRILYEIIDSFLEKHERATG